MTFRDELYRAQGFMRPMGIGGGGGGSPQPDPRMGEAALKQANIGEDWLKFFQSAYEEGRPRQAEFDDLSKRVTESMLKEQDLASTRSQEYYQREKDVLQPLEDQMVSEAKAFGTEADQERAASRAAAEVGAGYAAQRQNIGLDMARYGIRPEEAALDRSRLAEASAGTVAANDARERARLQGIAMRSGAAAQLRGLPGSTTAAGGLATAAGSGALNATSAANQYALQRTQSVGQGFSGAMQGYGNQANILSGLYGSNVNAWNAQQSRDAGALSGLGALVGTIGAAALPMIFPSSKKLKHAKKPMDSSAGLAAVEKMPVEKWRYNKGVGDGGAKEHVGTYAEDFQEQVGGDGKTIDLGDAIGVTMSAVKELSKKVDRIERAVGLSIAKKAPRYRTINQGV